MEYLIFTLKSAFFDFSRNKGRTLLTSLGILIGVLSVVLLTAFGLGLRKYIKQQFEDLGSNILRVVPGQILQNGSFSSSGGLGSIQFNLRDYQSMERVKGAEYVIPVYTRSIVVTVGKNTEISSLYSSSASIFKALNTKAEFGQLFTERNVSKRSKVVVIGPTLAEKIFNSKENAIGKTLKIDNQSYRVIGVTNKKGGGFGGPDFDSFTYMPYTTGFVLNSDKKFQAIIVLGEDDVNLSVLKKRLEENMLKRYEEDEFSVIEQEELLLAISSIFSIINTVLVAIAAISLVVGGIGIMNIMYVTVTERIKEIGIRRALGARKFDILSQFLIESVILSLLGGLSGLTLSYIIVLFIQKFFPAYIDLQSVILALGVSSAIGIIFGVFPAKKAADLSPIDAIRYE